LYAYDIFACDERCAETSHPTTIPVWIFVGTDVPGCPPTVRPENDVSRETIYWHKKRGAETSPPTTIPAWIFVGDDVPASRYHFSLSGFIFFVLTLYIMPHYHQHLLRIATILRYQYQRLTVPSFPCYQHLLQTVLIPQCHQYFPQIAHLPHRC